MEISSRGLRSIDSFKFWDHSICVYSIKSALSNFGLTYFNVIICIFVVKACQRVFLSSLIIRRRQDSRLHPRHDWGCRFCELWTSPRTFFTITLDTICNCTTCYWLRLCSSPSSYRLYPLKRTYITNQHLHHGCRLWRRAREARTYWCYPQWSRQIQPRNHTDLPRICHVAMRRQDSRHVCQSGTTKAVRIYTFCTSAKMYKQHIVTVMIVFLNVSYYLTGMENESLQLFEVYY